LRCSQSLHSYIRLGYDPRQIPSQTDAVLLPAWNQPIPIRISSAIFDVFSKRLSGGAGRAVDDSVSSVRVRVRHNGAPEVSDADACHATSEGSSGQKPWLQISSEDALLSPPTFRSFSIIPALVQNPLFVEWKANAQPSPAYDQTNGWFTSETLETMRDIVERALHDMLTDDEFRSMSAIDKEHGRVAGGRKGRQYTSVLRRRAHRMRRRSQEYGRERIKELAALAPLAGASLDAVAGNASHQQQPASSAPPASLAASKANAFKAGGMQRLPPNLSALNSQSDYEPSSQASRPDIMSQLSSEPAACLGFSDLWLY
jgi:hypothetical protein